MDLIEARKTTKMIEKLLGKIEGLVGVGIGGGPQDWKIVILTLKSVGKEKVKEALKPYIGHLKENEIEYVETDEIKAL